MTLEARIRSALAALTGDRVFPLVAPADTARPYVVLTGAGLTPSSYTLARVGNTDRRLMQIDVYSDADAGFDAHDSLAHAVRRALEDIGGRVSSGGHDYESAARLYRARLDLNFWHRQ